MRTIQYRYYFIEATKITFFCLLTTLFMSVFVTDKNTLLIAFNMAVMSAAATFTGKKLKPLHAMLGSGVIILSILSGGILGYYLPTLSNLFVIIYAGLAFLLPKTPIKASILITGSVMFLVFKSIPLNIIEAANLLVCGLVVMAAYFGFTYAVNKTFHHKLNYEYPETNNSALSAITVILALSLAWITSLLLQNYTNISHLYWIGLTVLVIMQGSRGRAIKTAFKRIIVNFCGAIFIIILFNYLVPNVFWLNFAILVLFLYLIFSLGFSYIGRTLFIEMFVLSLTHFLGSYHDVIAIDRVILTTIGGLLVILSALISYYFIMKPISYKS